MSLSPGDNANMAGFSLISPVLPNKMTRLLLCFDKRHNPNSLCLFSFLLQFIGEKIFILQFQEILTFRLFFDSPVVYLLLLLLIGVFFFKL